jgi:hypothetical protein
MPNGTCLQRWHGWLLRGAGCQEGKNHAEWDLPPALVWLVAKGSWLLGREEHRTSGASFINIEHLQCCGGIYGKAGRNVYIREACYWIACMLDANLTTREPRWNADGATQHW